MRQKLYRALTVLLIAAGAGLLLYPVVGNLVARFHHSTAIQTYNDAVSRYDPDYIEAELARAQAYNEMLTGGGIKDPFVPGSGYVVPEDYESVLNINGTIGYLEIPAADISLPIYHGVSEATLMKGVGHLNATAFPVGGAGNHAVLTAHRGVPTSKLFTDLDKLTAGDVFFIYVLDEVYAYAVEEVKIVQPSDTADLRPVQGEDRVTLLTCHPYGINSHRLLVRGVRTDVLPEDVERASGANPLVLLALLPLGVGAAALYRKHRRHGRSRRIAHAAES